MMGFNLDKKENGSENKQSDWNISQSRTNDTLKKSFNKPSSPLEASTYSDHSRKNFSSQNHKSMIQKLKSNKRHPCKPKKSIQFAGNKRSSIQSVLHKPKFSITSKSNTSVKASSKVKNYSMVKKYMLKKDNDKESKKFSILKKKPYKNSTPVSASMCMQGRSSDLINNLSQISGRSFYSKSNATQTPKSAMKAKFKTNGEQHNEFATKTLYKSQNTPKQRAIPRPKPKVISSPGKAKKASQKMKEIKSKFTPSRNQKMKSDGLNSYENSKPKKIIFQQMCSKPTTVSSRLRKMKEQALISSRLRNKKSAEPEYSSSLHEAMNKSSLDYYARAKPNATKFQKLRKRVAKTFVENRLK